MWRSAARSIGTCLALLCFFAVSSADPSPPSRADVTSGVRVAQRLIDTIPSPWRLDGDVRMAGDDAPVAQGNFVQASYALNKASLDSVATFSRAGNAMQFDSSGYLTYGPNNLLTQSNTFSNAAWTKSTVTITSGITDPLGGTNAFTITATAANGSILQFPATIIGNGNYSIWARRRTGTGTVWLRNPAGTDVIVTGSITGSWTQISSGTATSSGAALVLTINASGDALDVYAAVASAVTYETSPRTADQVITTASAYYGPRIDYDPNTLAVKGLLIEEARTNLAIQSATMASGWLDQGLTNSTDGTLWLDGGAARKLTLQATSLGHTTYSAAVITTTAGNAYSASWNVKAGNYSKVYINAGDGTRNAFATFDISGTADISASQASGTSHTSISGSGKYLGNGWFRLTLNFTAAASSTGHFFESGAVQNLTGNTANGFGEILWTAAGTETFYVGQPQYGVGPFATSYIPTAAASVTRAADVVQLTGPALAAAQGSAATAILEVGGLPTQAATTRYLQYGAGSGLLIAMSGGSATTVYEQNTAGSASTTAVAGSGSIATILRAGVSWGSTGGRKLVANGGTIGVDASNNELATGAVNIGQGQGTYINGWLRSFAIYNQRLPDATLQAKSVVGASYAANDNGIRYAFADNDNLPVHWRVAL